MSSTCHMPCAYTHPIGHVHLVQRISTLGIEGRGDRDEETAGAVTRPGATLPVNKRTQAPSDSHPRVREVLSAVSSELPPHSEIRV